MGTQSTMNTTCQLISHVLRKKQIKICSLAEFMPSYLIITVSGQATSLKERGEEEEEEQERLRSKTEEKVEERLVAGCVPQNNASFYNHWA